MTSEENTQQFDVIAIGGGPAGSTFAQIVAGKGASVALCSDSNRLGSAERSPWITNYKEPQRGPDLVDGMYGAALDMGAQACEMGVECIYLTDSDQYRVANLSARSLFVATGVQPINLGLPREAELVEKGKGSFCVLCDSWRYEGNGSHVAVVGGGKTAKTYAEYLLKIGADVSVIFRNGDPHEEMPKGARIISGRHVNEYMFDDQGGFLGLRLSDGVEVLIDGVFWALGAKPNVPTLQGQEFCRDHEGYLVVGKESRLVRLDSVWAGGDVIRPGDKQIRFAVEDAEKAANNFLSRWRPHYVSIPKPW